jgi:rRNA maturation RNase YbeY
VWNIQWSQRRKKRRTSLTVNVFSTTTTHISFSSVKNLATQVIAKEKAGAKGLISVILVDDSKIQDLNQRYLNKNRPTDVMAFHLGESGGLKGEVYISVEKAKEQADRYNVSWEEELSRLVIHGILHLLGYDDRSTTQRKVMKAREEQYLKTTPLVRIKTK